MIILVEINSMIYDIFLDVIIQIYTMRALREGNTYDNSKLINIYHEDGPSDRSNNECL
jgi:hypothetical protein